MFPWQLKSTLSPVIVMHVPAEDTFAVSVSDVATVPQAPIALTCKGNMAIIVNNIANPKTPLFMLFFKKSDSI